MSIVDRLLGRWDPERVVREHGPDVMRHLRRIFGPGADVDDVFQAVFVEVLRSLPRFEGRSRLSTWIRRITWNVAYQEMRVAYRRPPALPLDEGEQAALPAGDVGGDVEAEIDQRRLLRQLYDALGTLEPKQRLPVIMHDIEGMTLREIADALGRPLPTVASQLYAGRARLADCVRDGVARDRDRRRARQRWRRR